MQEESLAEIVHSLFNLDAHLYTVALQSGCAKQLLSQGTQCFQDLCNSLTQQSPPASSDQIDMEDSGAPSSAIINQVFSPSILFITSLAI